MDIVTHHYCLGRDTDFYANFSEAWGASTVMKVQRFANRQTCRLAMINLHLSLIHI